MVKSGRTKVRYFCGLCQIACKDENGYKCHLETEGHIHRELAVSESLRVFTPGAEDRAFRSKFIARLVANHFGQTCLAHDVYRDLYPLDRGHNTVKGTCWGTLGVFVAQLRKEGRVEAMKGLKGWQVRVSSTDFNEEEKEEKLVEKRKKVVSKIVSLPAIKKDEVLPHSEATKREGSVTSFSMNSSKRLVVRTATAFDDSDNESDEDS